MERSPFAKYLEDQFNGGVVTQGVALGSELGLFKLMAELDRPFTSQELADAGKFKERYVREWLGGMAASRIIDYDAESGRFSVGRENLAVLTNSFESRVAGLIPLMGYRHEPIKDVFKIDGPPGLSQMSTPQLGPWLDNFRELYFPSVLENRVLKIEGLREKLEHGISVADVGCGMGRMATMIAERFPKCTVMGLDIDEVQLQRARDRAREKGLQNLHFKMADVENLPQEMIEKFDYAITHDTIHDLPFPSKALEQIYKSLKSDGIFSMFEASCLSSLEDNIGKQEVANEYFFGLYFCIAYSLCTPGGAGWGRTVGPEKITQFLRDAGFSNISIDYHNMNHFICYK